MAYYAANKYNWQSPDFSMEARQAKRERLLRAPLANIVDNIPLADCWPDDNQETSIAPPTSLGAPFMPIPRFEQLSLSKPFVYKALSPEEEADKFVEEALDQASNDITINLSGLGLTKIPSGVGNLKYSTSIAGPTPQALNKSIGPSFSKRSLARTASAPAVFPSPNNSLFGETSIASIQLVLEHNSLRMASFPSRFFELDNLTILNLRHNDLEELPASIANLRNLKQLNVAANKLTYFPSEILKLQLTDLLYHPNPFLSSETATVHPISNRKLSPLKIHNRVPTLLESTYRKALQQTRNKFTRTSTQAFLSPSSPGRVINQIAASQSDEIKYLPSHLNGPFLPLLRLETLGNEVEYDPTGNHCASRTHEGKLEPRSFVQHAVERIEFVRVLPGAKDSMGLPIRWKGCGVSCLDFLEQE